MDQEISDARWKKIIFTVGIGSFMATLDSSVVNISLPQISTYFHASMSVIEWVVMAYLLVISSLLLTYGRFGDMYGHKKIYMNGFIIFTAGSVLCGLSPNISILITARIIQAVGAGMLMSMGPAIITDVTPSKNRGKALGMNGVAVYIALTSGPVLGGFLTSAFGWQSIFFVNVPVGIIGYFMGRKFLINKKTTETQKFDIPGAVLIFLAMVTLLFPLNYGETAGFRSPIIICSFVISVISFGAFIYKEINTEAPMMDLTLFRNRLFTMSNICLLISFIAGFSITLLLPFYFQDLRGMSASTAGLMMIPQPIMTIIITPISGILSDRVDSRYISSLGMLLVAIGMFLLSTLNINSTLLKSSLLLMLIGLGNGAFQTPNNSSIMGSVPEDRRGIASGILATMRNIGMVLGTAIAGAVFTGQENHLTAVLKLRGISGEALRIQSFTGAFHITYVMAGCLALAAAAASLTRGPLKKTQIRSGEV